MKLHSIDLKKIRIQDPFWSKHVDLVKDVIIPYQWEAMNDRVPDAEPSHCLENFAIAAGRKEGKFYGEVFQDTDLAKWLETVGFTLAVKKDEKLEQLADDAINLIAEAQQEDGYPGHQEVELGLIKLYHVTGKKKYLELAKYFIDARGCGEDYFRKEMNQPGYRHIWQALADYQPEYSQSGKPVREQDKAEGHAVRAVYMYSAMADLAAEYEDKELLDACVRLWNNIVQKQMYITGGIGTSGYLERFTTDYDLPNDRNYSESCASIGLAMFGIRMANITRDASYIDVVERALYNTVLAGIALDGKGYAYVELKEDAGTEVSFAIFEMFGNIFIKVCAVILE